MSSEHGTVKSSPKLKIPAKEKKLAEKLEKMNKNKKKSNSSSTILESDDSSLVVEESSSSVYSADKESNASS